MRVFIGLCLVAFAAAARLDVPSTGKIINLLPKTGSGRVESRFDLYAPAGSKMVLTCIFKTYSCAMATIKVDDGEIYTQHCPEKYSYVFKNSWKNKMTVTIENVGSAVGAYCQAVGTKPYIDVPETFIDSSEHGVMHKSKQDASCKCGWTNKAPGRIVGGKETGVNEYPWPALLMFTANRFPFCGASIITESHVLTAAHCTDPFKNRALSVAVGEHDIRTTRETSATKVHDVIARYQHTGYNDNSNLHDIAILEVAPKIAFNNLVGPVCLPARQQDHIDQFIKVMGWGLTRDSSVGGSASPVLRKVNLRVIDNDVCKVIYKTDSTRPTQICTYNNLKDSCQGDSGGPLVKIDNKTNKYYQVALVSYGRKCASTDPAVNTDVAAYMDWIKEQLAKSRSKASLCH